MMAFILGAYLALARLLSVSVASRESHHVVWALSGALICIPVVPAHVGCTVGLCLVLMP
jgi:hypothetical protein